MRLDVGLRDLAKQEAVAVRRDTKEKITLPITELGYKIKRLLDQIHNSLYARAKDDLESHKKLVRFLKEMHVS